jgi:hypothetical protein
MTDFYRSTRGGILQIAVSDSDLRLLMNRPVPPGGVGFYRVMGGRKVAKIFFTQNEFSSFKRAGRISLRPTTQVRTGLRRR